LIEWECAAQDMHGNGSRSLFIRTVTVGLGISPSLLTLFIYQSMHKRSWAIPAWGNYHRWGISPRPENVTNINYFVLVRYFLPYIELFCTACKHLCIINFKNKLYQRSSVIRTMRVTLSLTFMLQVKNTL